MTLSNSGFKQVSFVNSIATTKGGRHTDYIADQVVAKLIETVKKKNKKDSITIKPFQVRSDFSSEFLANGALEYVKRRLERLINTLD